MMEAAFCHSCQPLLWTNVSSSPQARQQKRAMELLPDP
jgi:hypothetical protein